MFGWLKKWGPAARNARDEREIEAAIERTAAMAAAINARRAREKAAQDAARAAVTARWEAARAQQNERTAFERNVIRDMQREREAKLAPRPPAQPKRDSESTPAPDTMPLDMGTPVYLVPIHHLPSTSDWCASSGSDASSSDSGSSDSGGSCGGGD